MCLHEMNVTNSANNQELVENDILVRIDLKEGVAEIALKWRVVRVHRAAERGIIGFDAVPEPPDPCREGCSRAYGVLWRPEKGELFQSSMPSATWPLESPSVLVRECDAQEAATWLMERYVSALSELNEWLRDTLRRTEHRQSRGTARLLNKIKLCPKD